MKNKIYAALLAGSMLWCLSIIAAPIAGLPAVYRFFSLICHQIPERSWRLFGEPLPVCIRCASIYFGFVISLSLAVPARSRWLRFSVFLLIAEFVAARLLIDTALLRSMTGIMLGVCAAPFVRKGIEEMFARGKISEPV